MCLVKASSPVKGGPDLLGQLVDLVRVLKRKYLDKNGATIYLWPGITQDHCKYLSTTEEKL